MRRLVEAARALRESCRVREGASKALSACSVELARVRSSAKGAMTASQTNEILMLQNRQRRLSFSAGGVDAEVRKVVEALDAIERDGNTSAFRDGH